MMNIEQIRQASHYEFELQRARAGAVVETTPRVVSSEIEAFAATLSAQEARFLDVVADLHGLYGWCSDGVDQKVRADGGRPVFGWIVWERPGILLDAEFHAVWQKAEPDHDLVDITPKPAGEKSILFVPDYTYPATFDFKQRPRNRRIRLLQMVDRHEVAKDLAKALPESGRAYETKRAARAGLSLEDWMLRKVPANILPEAIDALIAALGEQEAYIDTLNGRRPLPSDNIYAALAEQTERADTRVRSLVPKR